MNTLYQFCETCKTETNFDYKTVTCKKCKKKSKKLPRKTKEMRRCRTCCFEIELEEFGRDKKTKDGYKTECKNCERDRRYAKSGRDTPDKIIYFNEEGLKLCIKCSEYKDVVLFYIDKNSCYSSYCILCNSIKNKENYNPNKAKIYNKIYNFKNKEQITINSKKWNFINKDKISENKKEYYKNNKDIIKVKKREQYKKKYNSDPLFRFKESIRRSILKALKGKEKAKKTFDIVGLSLEEFKQHIEEQFLPWMTWENYGKYNGELCFGWDLDHVIPISSAKTEEEVYNLSHWSNFQPLCSKINREIKKNKLNGGF